MGYLNDEVLGFLLALGPILIPSLNANEPTLFVPPFLSARDHNHKRIVIPHGYPLVAA